MAEGDAPIATRLASKSFDRPRILTPLKSSGVTRGFLLDVTTALFASTNHAMLRTPFASIFWLRSVASSDVGNLRSCSTRVTRYGIVITAISGIVLAHDRSTIAAAST